MGRRLLAGALAATLAGAPTTLLASGFQIVEQNGSGLGNAYSGQAASVKDASAIFFNPANLTRTKGFSFAISVEPIGVGTDFEDAGSTRPSLGALTIPVPLGGNGGDAGGWIPVPNAYLSWQAAEKVWLGLGVNAPFGLKTEWDSDWVGRFHGIESEVKTMNINPTVAFKVNESFSIGAGASYQQLEATLTRNVPYGGISYATAARLSPVLGGAILSQLGGPAGLAREGLASVEGDKWAWGFNVGATVTIDEKARIAATYRHKIKYDLTGDVTFDNAPTFSTSTPIPPLNQVGAGLNAAFASGPVTTEIELPYILSIAASYETDKYEVMADWTQTGWDSIQALDIYREGADVPFSSEGLNFENTWRAGIGFGYQLNDSAKLRLGYAYDKSPVQDEFRTPRLPDNNRNWVAAGIEYKIGKNGALDLGYAHIFVEDASSDLPNQDTPTSSPKGALVGNYKANVNIVGLQYRHSF